MTKRSKKYREAAEMVDRNNLYTDEQAVALLKSMPKRGFDETVEATYVLNVDPRKADQLIRGTVNLPHGTGKTARVLVFARGPQATAARPARCGAEDGGASRGTGTRTGGGRRASRAGPSCRRIAPVTPERGRRRPAGPARRRRRPPWACRRR